MICCLIPSAIWVSNQARHRDAGHCYEYVCSYVDDFGLKRVTANPEVFLGGSFGRDPDGTLFWGAKRYIAQAMETYERMMGVKPKICTTLLPEKSHPELDTKTKLDEQGCTKYQLLIGCLQQVVTLGRFDIACALMTMSCFRVAPRKGHLELLGNIFGYLRKYPDGAIRFHVSIPPHEDRFTPVKADWDCTVYGKAFEEMLYNMPEPKGALVRQTITVDANLDHCKVTG
jgi:hypothetical protein